MFKELAPIVAERNLHIVLSAAADGRITLYVEPAKKEAGEDDTFVTPLRLRATPEEFDAQLPTILSDWVKAREQVTQSLTAALAASKKQLEENAAAAKKAAADKAKKPLGGATAKPGAKPAAIAPATPSLLDATDGDDATAPPAAAQAPVVDTNAAQSTATTPTPSSMGDTTAPAAASGNAPPAAPPAAAVAAVEGGDTIELF